MSYTLLQQAATIVGAVELYEFDFGEGVVEYYCSARRSIFHDWREGDGLVEYKPLPLKRSVLKNQGQADPDTIAIGLPTRPSFMGLLGKGAVSRLQLRIIRGFGPLTTATEANYQRYWFVGDLSDLDVTRTKTQANLRSLEYIFRETQVPRIIFQGSCNNDLFGLVCGIQKSDFTFTFDLREVYEDGTLLRANVNPATQDPSGTQSYDPDDHIQLGDGLGDPPLDEGYGGLGFYTLGRVWRDSLPEAPRHILAHTYLAGDGANQCRFKLLAPLPTLETDGKVGPDEVPSNNLLLDSEVPNGPAWSSVSGPTVELYDAPGPFFATKATRITTTVSGSRVEQAISSLGFLIGVTYTFALWIRAGTSGTKRSDVILTNQDGDVLRVRIKWDEGEIPTLQIVTSLGDYVSLNPRLSPVGEEGWFLFSVDVDYGAGDGNVTVQIYPDSDSGGSFNKSILFYAGMVKNGAGLTEYEPNQAVWLSASFGCSKSSYPCFAKFDNLVNRLAFDKQPSVHPVLTGFRRP